MTVVPDPKKTWWKLGISDLSPASPSLILRDTKKFSVQGERPVFLNMPLLIWSFKFDYQTETTAVYRYTPCLTQELPPGRYFIHCHWLIGLGWDFSIEESFTSIFWASPLPPTLSFWNYATCNNNNDSNINNDEHFPDLCNSFFYSGMTSAEADPGEGHGEPAPAPPLFLDQTETRSAKKIFEGLDDLPTPLISRSGSGTALVTASKKSSCEFHNKSLSVN